MMGVYMIQAGEGGPVKIGRAKDAANRLAALQTGHYEELRVIRTLPGGLAVESWLHAQFANFQMRGEWFHFSADMLTIDVPLLEDAGLAVPEFAEFITSFGGIGEFARKLGVSSSAVAQWLAGKRCPRASSMQKIIDISGGRVMPEHFMLRETS